MPPAGKAAASEDEVVDPNIEVDLDTANGRRTFSHITCFDPQNIEFLELKLGNDAFNPAGKSNGIPAVLILNPKP